MCQPREIRSRKRRWQPVEPAPEERVDCCRAKPVADALECGRVGARAEAVVECFEPDAGLLELALCPTAGVGSGRGVRLSAGPSPRPAPPNRTCVFSRIRLSTGPCRWVRPRSAPWRSTRGWECDPPGS